MVGQANSRTDEYRCALAVIGWEAHVGVLVG